MRTVLDLLALVVSVGLALYGFSLMRVFREGMLERPFTLLAAAPIIFAAASLIDGLDAMALLVDPGGLISRSLNLIFIIYLFIAFSVLIRVWRAGKR